MATTQEIPRDTWRTYFDEISRTLGTVKATVEITGRDLGAQVAADGLVLTGVSYDDRDDVVVIGLDAPGGHIEEAEHLVEHPQKILVATGADAGVAIDIEDADAHQTIIRLATAPALPGD
ncbi:MAG: hypothetical protein QOD44_2522 [Solirubrobacteraceae bacterium]|jgi:hypothetical protein|nr:hypothetical protein [Solirubrobacteraceae bacterium]MEA2318333.1 hypothetical protein [Solirubrobacteraceae bacterium]